MTYIELYQQCCERYTIDDVAYNVDLSTLYLYLRDKCSTRGGMYRDADPRGIEFLITKFIQP